MSTEEKDQKLAEIQAKLAEIEERRRARTAKDEVELASAELERAELIEKFENEHGSVGQGIAVLEAPSGELIIVKKPKSATYRKFQDSKASTSEAFAALVKPCVVHPAAERYAELLEEYPAMLLRLSKAVTSLAGFRDDEKH